MEGSTLYLHIGLHKTGSSFLQSEVFPSAKNLYFLNKPNWNLISGYTDPTSLARFMASNTGVWDAMGDAFFTRANKDTGRDPDEEGDLLISDEQGPFGWRRNDPHRMAVHLGKIQSVMRDHFDELKILIVIRRQDTWLASAYSEVSGKFKNASQSHFANWVEEHTNYRKKYFWGRGVRLNYSNLISEVLKYVPSSNLKVIPYEALKESPSLFVGEVEEFIGKPVVGWESKYYDKKSTSKKRWQISPYRKRSIWLRPGRLFYNLGLNPRINIPDPFRESEIKLTEEISCSVLSRYKESNLDMDKYVELKKYGYLIDE